MKKLLSLAVASLVSVLYVGCGEVQDTNSEVQNTASLISRADCLEIQRSSWTCYVQVSRFNASPISACAHCGTARNPVPVKLTCSTAPTVMATIPDGIGVKPFTMTKTTGSYKYVGLEMTTDDNESNALIITCKKR